ncbi:hypothetical protein [Kitasatospora sp. NPDC085879]|uniref:hypothetical protein n=1 Tax=Kitasatospora sp. NPDC085879 TaxID=3154769 RepID=UPI0034489E00
MWVDLEAANMAASVVGAVVALAGLTLSVWQLLPASGAAEVGIRVQATGPHSVAAGGDITRNAFGARSKVGSAPGSAPGSPAGPSAPVVGPAEGRQVEAVDGGLAAGGAMGRNAVGDDAEVW